MPACDVPAGRHMQRWSPTFWTIPYHAQHICKVDSKCQVSGCLDALFLGVHHPCSLALGMALEDIHSPEGESNSPLEHEGLATGSCQSDSRHFRLDMWHYCNFYLKQNKTIKLVGFICYSVTVYYCASHKVRWLCVMNWKGSTQSLWNDCRKVKLSLCLSKYKA
jgi:hypothetical protein